MLEHYERIVPGVAAQIVRMAEKEQAHRHEIETKVVDGRVADAKLLRAETRRGQVFGVLVALAGITLSGVVAVFVPGAAGAILSALFGGGSLGSIVYAFLNYTKQAQPKPASK